MKQFRSKLSAAAKINFIYNDADLFSDFHDAWDKVYKGQLPELLKELDLVYLYVMSAYIVMKK